MDVFEAIKKRHSYRGGFKDLPVPRSDLERIVEAGLCAPSGCNAQTTSFVIVDDPSLIAGIAAIAGKQVVREARAIVVCIVEHRPVYGDISFGVEDCAAAVENMLLAVTALGYATVWIDGALRHESKGARIGALLNVPGDMDVRIILPIGVPAEQVSAKPKLPFAKRAWFNRYNG